jgi:hypothetical protein
MSEQKPVPVLSVSFDREGIKPARIPFNALAEVISAVQALATGGRTEGAPRESEEPGEDDKFRLMKIKTGSAIYSLAGPPPVRFADRLRLADAIVRDPETADGADFVLSPLERLSQVAKALDTEITLRDPSKHREVLARFGGDSYRRVADSLLVSGDTELFGKVLRVGGATERKCMLRIPSQQHAIYCRIESVNVARELGRRLYQEVLAAGTANWLRSNWHVIAFTVRDVSQPKPGSLLEAREAVRKAGGSDWDNIVDPSAYLNGLGE